jgi:hypothetical protein
VDRGEVMAQALGLDILDDEHWIEKMRKSRPWETHVFPDGRIALVRRACRKERLCVYSRRTGRVRKMKLTDGEYLTWHYNGEGPICRSTRYA